jgi:hypothetical protein
MAKSQRGFLTQIGIGILILLILAALGAQKFAWSVKEATAESTGRYLFTVRSAVLNALSTYDFAFTQVDTSSAPPGVYPVPPAWVVFSGAEQTVSVNDLKVAGLLANGFPDTPPSGRSAHVKILRSGTCPGDTCKLDAYVYSCWPISQLKPVGAVDNTTCPAAPAGTDFDANMVGVVITATSGYGGTNYFAPATMRGALFNVPTATLGLPVVPGYVAVLASLDDGMNSQFVRQGDTRHIYLKDNLTVSKVVSAGEGLLLPTNAPVGGACSTDGVYGTSTRGSYVMCKGGQWFELVNHILLSTQSLPNGAALVTPTCPGANMQPFAYASLQNSDVTMTGSDISITGVLGGAITGTGNVSSAGTVSVSGTFNGTTTSGPGSSIRVAQGVSIVGSTVVINPATANARALVMQGCRFM